MPRLHVRPRIEAASVYYAPQPWKLTTVRWRYYPVIEDRWKNHRRFDIFDRLLDDHDEEFSVAGDTLYRRCPGVADASEFMASCRLMMMMICHVPVMVATRSTALAHHCGTNEKRYVHAFGGVAGHQNFEPDALVGLSAFWYRAALLSALFNFELRVSLIA